MPPWPRKPSFRAVAAVRSYSRAPDVGAAVDHRHADAPAVVAQRDLRAARQRLVRDAELGVAQRAAAAGLLAVEAGAVPGGERLAVDVQPADPALGAVIAVARRSRARARSSDRGACRAACSGPGCRCGRGRSCASGCPCGSAGTRCGRRRAAARCPRRSPGGRRGCSDLALADADLRDARGRRRRGRALGVSPARERARPPRGHGRSKRNGVQPAAQRGKPQLRHLLDSSAASACGVRGSASLRIRGTCPPPPASTSCARGSAWPNGRSTLAALRATSGGGNHTCAGEKPAPASARSFSSPSRIRLLAVPSGTSTRRAISSAVSPPQ